MNFREKVYFQVSKIPQGKVATYGQIASLIDQPRAARQVGFALRALNTQENKVPWWRVINAKGQISINQGAGGIEKLVQADLLREDGVEVTTDLQVDLANYQWRPQLPVS